MSKGALAADTAKVLRVVVDAEPVHLNPILDPDVWGYRIAHDLLCEPLIRRKPVPLSTKLEPQSGPDRPADFEGVLAQSFSADEMGVTVTLRQGVVFHDGKRLTAHDVRFTLERLYGSKTVAPRTQAFLHDLEKVTVYAAYKVRIDLRRPNGSFLSGLAEIDILPEHLYSQGSLLYQPGNRRPVCTGPYKLNEWRKGPGGILSLSRFDRYYGTPGAVDGLHFLIQPDGTKALALLRRGGADLMGPVPVVYVPEQTEPLRGRLELVELLQNQMSLLLFSGRSPLWSKPPVRKAIAALIDRQRLVRDVRHGLAEPLWGSVQRAESLAQIEEILDGAGMTRLSAGGPRVFAQRPVRMQLLCPSHSSEAVAVVRRLSEALSQVGIKLEPEYEDMLGLQGRLRRGAFDAALVAFSWTGMGSRPVHDNLWPLLHKNGPQAYTRTGDNPELDLALDAVRRATKEEELFSAQKKLQTVLDEQSPLTLLYRPRHLFLLSKNVNLEQVQIAPHGGFFILRSLQVGSQRKGGKE